MRTQQTQLGGGRRSRGAEAVLGSALNASAALSPALAGRMAYAVFRAPLRRGKVLPGEREAHIRARTDELVSGSRRVITYQWGDGERPVLMLHGWQSRASRFAAFIPRLEALGLSPVAFDAPGHGDSGGRTTTVLENAEIAGRLQDRYGPFHAVLAHSFGVLCAFLALRERIKAERLVAVAGVSDFGFLVDEFSRLLRLDPALRAVLRRKVETRLFPEVENVWERFDATHRPADFDLPMLIVHDEGDRTVPLQQAHRLVSAHDARAELLVTTGLSHRRILGAPLTVDSALDFLNPQRS
ncbi:alpha/beta hydrolase [Streptomyces smyrnaeus]|uniref:alpha/beta hydrolase n=1 Tax=Streptomyces TaxID=1883 RepID=UPI000C1A292A|nr:MULTISPECIES: alpha/beta hydrolase [unclassified Streptomyces]MBQ0866053.1 alpha/beta hydrolase [Streptomyces sp. RK75]MBQ1121963.1 alpha/beta hydrolase [Streptomyces sp. B15]MBQ1159574.1 alpha/beta hydrolase [Streptomyces sp. A73]